MPSLSPTLSIRTAAAVDRSRPPGHRASRVEGCLRVPSSTILSDPIPLIDRKHELEAIRGQLLSETVRLLTLMGPGGVGKTRLALAAAESLQSDFADGTRFVELGALQEAECLASAIAQAAFAALTAALAGAHQGKSAQAAQPVATVEAWGEITADVVSLASREPEVSPELQAHLRHHPAEPETLAMSANEVVDLARACLEAPRGGLEDHGPAGAAERPRPLLSERERTVLRLISEGLPNKQIATALSIAERTVKAHVTAAMNKLGVNNRAHAAVVAIQRELL
jgi:DNA-binding NarL/FixJ family response regulator